MDHIPFNQPYLIGKELEYIQDAVLTKKLSGNGKYTQLCQHFFENRFHFKKCLLTTSCTDALEMAAILLDIRPGDEVIIPSFTFVSTANAFILRGAKVVFADSGSEEPNMNVSQLESLITAKTKAIVPVHYAGVACDMDPIMELADRYNLFVIEDAAQAVDSYYKGRPLGGIGHLAAFSFHETKNVISGEGGMLVVNDERFIKRSEIIWEKGTNRSAFWRGEVDKYGWVDIGSSFLPSEIIAAFLYAQLENLDKIQKKRIHLSRLYFENLKELKNKKLIKLPKIHSYAFNNGHMFYMVCDTFEQRQNLIAHLKEHNINAVFHYLSLHTSPYFCKNHDGRKLPHSDRYSDCLLRLPLFYDLSEEGVLFISNKVQLFFNGKN